MNLSILIPTFNRGKKLLRLLKAIEEDVSTHDLQNRVDVFISDNASGDDTQRLMSNYRSPSLRYTYIRQAENIGAERNFLFLYERARSEYVRFLSDDDIPLPGSTGKILNCVSERKPDILLSSFVQPPKSTERTFNYDKEVEEITEEERIIKLVGSYPKISIFVMKKIALEDGKRRELEPFIGNGFSFISLAYSILDQSTHPKLCVISEPLATCDDDFNKIGFPPDILQEYHNIFLHPFVLKHLPEYAKEMSTRSYYMGIDIAILVMSGILITKDTTAYKTAIKNLQWDMRALMKKPTSLAQMILLKCHMSWAYRYLFPAYMFLQKTVSAWNNEKPGIRI